MIVKFTVPGEPVGKGRPKFRRVGEYTQTYTPQKTAQYENLVKLEYERQCGNARFDDDAQLYLLADCYMAIPKSISKKKLGLMESKVFRPVRKPDASNAIKTVEDALNGIAYKDDSHIVDLRVRKFYSNRPRCEVTISDEVIKYDEE